MANLIKAKGFHRVNATGHNHFIMPILNLAANKFNQMKDRPVKDIDDALDFKYNDSWDDTENHWSVPRSGTACTPQITHILLPLKLHSQ